MRGRKPRDPSLNLVPPPESVGVPPDDLTPARKTIWWETVHAAPHLTRADRRALKTYVVAYDLWEQSVRMVDAKGLVTVDARHKKTPRSARWERVERSQAQVVAVAGGQVRVIAGGPQQPALTGRSAAEGISARPGRGPGENARRAGRARSRDDGAG
jgi:hypothetical protein